MTDRQERKLQIVGFTTGRPIHTCIRMPLHTRAIKKRPISRPLCLHGADNGIRTRDPHLGKVMLYQLSHVRMLSFQNLEATPGFEPGVKALQASALPLGHVAILASCLIKSWLVTQPAHLRQWSGQRDSNPRPSPWQGDALPAEPCPHLKWWALQDLNL